MNGRRFHVALAVLVAAVTISSADPVQWEISDGGNGHWYESVDCGVCNWHEASTLAAGMVWLGYQGHLATITTPEENAWIWTNVGTVSFWIGGYQLNDDDGPAGNWAWVTGEPWEWTNWGPDEPNDYLGQEDYIEFMQYEEGLWNDEYWNYPGVEDPGFIVEFELLTH